MKLTKTQREALAIIADIRDRQIRRIEREYSGAIASRWVFVSELYGKVRMPTLRALERAGWLERRPSDGFGPQVRIIGIGEQLQRQEQGAGK